MYSRKKKKNSRECRRIGCKEIELSVIKPQTGASEKTSKHVLARQGPGQE